MNLNFCRLIFDLSGVDQVETLLDAARIVLSDHVSKVSTQLTCVETSRRFNVGHERREYTRYVSTYTVQITQDISDDDLRESPRG